MKTGYTIISFSMISKLFSSTVIHERLFPFKNRFVYKVLSTYIDYDELNILSKQIKIFSYNKFNFFSFHEIDHGYRDGRKLKSYINNYLKKNNIMCNNLKIKILCFPRILGYVFNPLSIIYCFDGSKLFAIFYEVKNTSNEQHTYFFANKKPVTNKSYSHRCNKIFYVSPFIKMNGYYKFYNKIPKDDFSLLIEMFDEKKNKILIASQFGTTVKFSSVTLFKSLLKNPLMTFKVISAILYQSLVIMKKGGKYYSRNKKTIDSISYEGNL